jgi:hypothetical protein
VWHLSGGPSAAVILEDLDRLARIVTTSRRPAQIVFAGTARRRLIARAGIQVQQG